MVEVVEAEGAGTDMESILIHTAQLLIIFNIKKSHKKQGGFPPEVETGREQRQQKRIGLVPGVLPHWRAYWKGSIADHLTAFDGASRRSSCALVSRLGRRSCQPLRAPLSH